MRSGFDRTVQCARDAALVPARSVASTEELAHAALELLSTAVVMARMNGRVVYANAAARALAARKDGLRLGSERSGMAGSSSCETTALRVAIAAAAGAPADRASGRGGVVPLRRNGGGRPYVVIVHPLAAILGREPLALLVILDMAQRPSPPSALLVCAFGLTAAEARLAIALCHGCRVEEAAREFSLSRNTVRTQLRRVFAKTGTGRQADLIRLLANLTAIRGTLV